MKRDVDKGIPANSHQVVVHFLKFFGSPRNFFGNFWKSSKHQKLSGNLTNFEREIYVHRYMRITVAMTMMTQCTDMSIKV